MGVVLPGANLLTVPLTAVVGHVEVAAGVERQGPGISQPGEGGGGRGAQGRWAADHGRVGAGVDVDVRPASVMALAVGLVEVTVAPAPIESVPMPSSPVPSAFRSAPRLRVLVPLSTVAPAATTRFVRAVTSIGCSPCRPGRRPASGSPGRRERRCWAGRRSEPMMTFCWAVLALSANWMRLLLVPIGPVVSSVTVAPVVAISAAVLLALAATMPPVPAVRLIVPPLPLRAVPVPAPSSRMIWPVPAVVLDDQGRGAGGGGRRGGREGDVAGLGCCRRWSPCRWRSSGFGPARRR